MDTNFGRIEMLALRTMAGNELENDVMYATSFFKRSLMMFCMCVGLYVRNQDIIDTRTVETAFKHCVLSFVRPSHYDAYIVKCFTLV